jgi:hypothetical protein
MGKENRFSELIVGVNVIELFLFFFVNNEDVINLSVYPLG